MPVIQSTIAGTRLVGRMCVGAPVRPPHCESGRKRENEAGAGDRQRLGYGQSRGPDRLRQTESLCLGSWDPIAHCINAQGAELPFDGVTCPPASCECAGNKNGLLLPNATTDHEMLHIKSALPDEVVVQRIDERLSALGNCIACNDYVALVHTDVDKVRRAPRTSISVHCTHSSSGGGTTFHETYQFSYRNLPLAPTLRVHFHIY